jgi:hypothetical protein
MIAHVKITVLRRTLNEEFVAECAAHTWETCGAFPGGQEFTDGYRPVFFRIERMEPERA